MNNTKVQKVNLVYALLKDYIPGSKDDDFIQVTEWPDGYGYDICINERHISLSWDELDLINHFVQTLNYEK